MRALVFAALALAPAAAHAQPPAAVSLETAGFEDFRDPIGRLEGGVLRVRLEARATRWQPWGEHGPAIVAHAFSADGAPPRVPGPLIRVAAGTPIEVTLRNPFDHPLVVRGFHDRHAPTATPFRVDSVVPPVDTMVVPPRSTAEVRFTAFAPGTYVYSGRIAGAPAASAPGVVSAAEADRPFVGVLIVDPAGEPVPDERIFLLNHWGDRDLPRSFLPATRFFVNGRSWPHTERLEYAQGDTVRWRVINFTGRPHPMHLHGFYFRVDARGDLIREEVYAPEDRRLAVTEMVPPARSMRMTWVPTEPGNWIFHCHFMRHMSHLQNAPLDGGEATHAAMTDDAGRMGGLVVGIHVRPRPDHAPRADVARRRLRLHIGMRPGVFGEEAGYGFVVQAGELPPAPDSVRFPGSPIVLTRGEPTEILVRNHADVPLGVHWHGLELESWADGVPGWSGSPGRVMPAIAPGDSFRVRMTPPRAGTFMYHVHSEPGHQLALGLYGPFLVLEPGHSWDPEADRLFLLGSLGPGDDPAPAVNGSTEPHPLELVAGRTYRLRFMHISPDDTKRVQLLGGDEPVTWRMIAKDAADLPSGQVRDLPADLAIHVGETYDFLWTPEREGDFTLRVTTTFDRGAAAFPRPAPPPHTAEIPVRVR